MCANDLRSSLYVLAASISIFCYDFAFSFYCVRDFLQELYVRVNMWEKAEEERIAQENNSISNRMLRSKFFLSFLSCFCVVSVSVCAALGG